MIPFEKLARAAKDLASDVADAKQAPYERKMQEVIDALLLQAQRLERLAVVSGIDLLKSKEAETKAQRKQLEDDLSQRPDV